MASSVVFRLGLSSMVSALMVLTAMLFYLSIGVPENPGPSFDQPAAGFSFAFGSGFPQQDHMLVDGFANGYALLSSGAVSIQADKQAVLVYSWVPTGKPAETAFFWRQKGDAENVLRTEITTTGTHMIDLSTEAGWQGEIIEIGYLMAGQDDEPVQIGHTSILPYSLKNRIQLMWQAWATFEQRSQQSINFLEGGDYRQVISLPLLLFVWLLISLLLLKLFSRKYGNTPLLPLAGALFLIAWILIDIRWIANSFRQTEILLQSPWLADQEQRLSNDLDGEIYRYVQRLKSDVLGDEPGRILIIGDEDAIDYYLLRAKYHLLPHSVHVTGHFNKGLSPGTLKFIIFFGQSGDITGVPGWNATWRKALTEIDRENLGVVYKLKTSS